MRIAILLFILCSCSTTVTRRPAGKIAQFKDRVFRKIGTMIPNIPTKESRSCASNIAVVLGRVRIQDMSQYKLSQISKKGELGRGQAHIVYDSEVNGESLAFLRLSLTNKEAPLIMNHLGNARKTFNSMDEDDIRGLAKISFEEAKQATSLRVTEHMPFFGSSATDPRNEVFRFYIRELSDILYMDQIGRMNFGNIPNPFPKIKGYVFDHRGLYMGHLMEKVPGKDFDKLLMDRSISKEAFEKVVKEVDRQLDLLQSKQLLHGDIDFHLGNIMVDLTRSGELRKVTLIDFTFSVALSRSPSPKIERAKLRKLIESARRDYF
jgi:hypothetical protein